jgi:hypothetical protein
MSEPADLLYGFEAIGEHLGITGRQAEHLASKGGLPTFRLGRRVAARKSSLAAWLSDREGGACQADLD